MDLADCGDSHCILRDPSKPRGMHTNGGCQHLKVRSIELTRLLMAMGAEIVSQRRELEAARAVVEKVPAVLRLDPGCDDHATGLDWCDRCHEAHGAHADLQHAYNAAKAGKAVE